METKEIRCGVDIESILRRKLDAAVVHVGQQRVEGRDAGRVLPKCDLHSVVGWHEGTEHGLKVGAPCCQDGLVGMDHFLTNTQHDIRELAASSALEERFQVILDGGRGLQVPAVCSVWGGGAGGSLVPPHNRHHQVRVKGLK